MLSKAVCPGSFDPVTMGHIDVITRAASMFDEVIVVVMANYRKKATAFTAEERMAFLKRCTSDLPNVRIDSFDGLLAEYVSRTGAQAIIKGLRAVSDFEDEFQQALTNMRLAPGVETLFMTTKTENMFLSSSMVKQVCELGGDIAPFVPAEIRDDITKRLRRDGKI